MDLDLSRYPYRSTFTAIAKIVNPSEKDRFVAAASLAPLKAVLPADINPADKPDLLYISCDGAVGGMVNKNGDGVDAATAVAIHRSAQHKYISVDHDRDKIAGVVLFPALTKLGTHDLMADDVAAASNEPFNMSFAGVIWKSIQPQLSKYLVKVGDALDSDALSMSWEIAFEDYAVAVGSRNLFDAKLIKRNEPNFAAYDAMLRANKGEGKDPAGQNVSRVITGNALILGYSIVPNPAAEVKGILPLTFIENDNLTKQPHGEPTAETTTDLPEIPESQRSFFQDKAESGAGFHLCDITLRNGELQRGIPVFGSRFLPTGFPASDIASITIAQKSEEKNITPSQARVNLNTEPMKIDSIQSLESSWTEVRKLESAAAIVDFVKAIQKGSEDYVATLAAKDALLKTAEDAKIAEAAKAAKLATSLAEIQKQLDDVTAKADATAANQKFQERMASFDEQYDLDDEDRAILASDIKALDTDEAFAAFSKKCGKLMAAKKKGAKPAVQKDQMDDDGDDDTSDAAKAAKAAEAEATKIKAALASAQADDKSFIRPGVNLDSTLVQQMADAFGASFKIDGKPVRPAAKQ